mmetsp:Transcript_4068/g.8854  ORF Transcript_4068/g.8854 Transcript_4068/m.8854 type:complete len:342 (-) Transcript_4068:962-1987(-)
MRRIKVVVCCFASFRFGSVFETVACMHACTPIKQLQTRTQNGVGIAQLFRQVGGPPQQKGQPPAGGHPRQGKVRFGQIADAPTEAQRRHRPPGQVPEPRIGFHDHLVDVVEGESPQGHEGRHDRAREGDIRLVVLGIEGIEFVVVVVEAIAEVVGLLLGDGRRRREAPLFLPDDRAIAEGEDPSPRFRDPQVVVDLDPSPRERKAALLDELDGRQARRPNHHPEGDLGAVPEGGDGVGASSLGAAVGGKAFLVDARDGRPQPDVNLPLAEVLEVVVREGLVEATEQAGPGLDELELDFSLEVGVPLGDVVVDEVVELGRKLAGGGSPAHHHEGKKTGSFLL